MGAISHLPLPPQSIEAEQSVLGGLLLDNAAFEQVADTLTESDFYRNEHRLIYRTIVRLIEAGKPADALTVAENLEEHGKLAAVGDRTYLSTLAVNTVSIPNIRRHAGLIRDRAMSRHLIERCRETIEAAMQPNGATPTEIAASLERSMFELCNRQRGEAVSLADAVAGAVAHLDELQAKSGGMAGLATGFADLDRITGGLSGGDLVILAGRPSMGKTTLGINICEHVAEHGGTVVMFSLEMSTQQLAMRLLAEHSRVPMYRLRAGRFEQDRWPKIAEAHSKLGKLPILLDDTGGISCSHVRARARRIQRRNGLALVVVDFLQLMRGEGETRNQEVGSISRGLKAIAKELNVSVIALSQLNRGVENRNDKRPTLADLRDSGEIEQDADTIAFLYRDQIYDPASPDKGTAELLIQKQRNGPTGVVRLWFREELMRFENYSGPMFESGSSRPPRAPRGFDYKRAQVNGS